MSGDGKGCTASIGRDRARACTGCVPDGDAARAVSFGATIPTVIAVARAASPPTAEMTGVVTGTRASSGAWVSHERGPSRSRSLPREMFTNARTRRGSNWVPAHRASSDRASAALAGSLYERADVITS